MSKHSCKTSKKPFPLNANFYLIHERQTVSTSQGRFSLEKVVISQPEIPKSCTCMLQQGSKRTIMDTKVSSKAQRQRTMTSKERTHLCHESNRPSSLDLRLPIRDSFKKWSMFSNIRFRHSLDTCTRHGNVVFVMNNQLWYPVQYDVNYTLF